MHYKIYLKLLLSLLVINIFCFSNINQDNNTIKVFNNIEDLSNINNISLSEKIQYNATSFLIEKEVYNAIETGIIPGCVILASHDGKVVFEKAYGNKSVKPKQEKLYINDLFDLASLTKVIATATALTILHDKGLIDFSKKVYEYLPEFKMDLNKLKNRLDVELPVEKSDNDKNNSILKKYLLYRLEIDSLPIYLPDLLDICNKTSKVNKKNPVYDKDEVTLIHLITHCSGLPAWESFYKRYKGRGYSSSEIQKLSIEYISNILLVNKPGTKFMYSDFGYMILAKIVEKISGRSITSFCYENIYKPLKMNDTGYIPVEGLRDRIVPTEETEEGNVLRGKVHDPNARIFGGVSGHAGLFSTIEDLKLYCDMILNNGKIGDISIISDKNIKLMTSNLIIGNMKEKRGIGWDILSSYSTLKGIYFSDLSFGHTGYTGTSIWIDPKINAYLIILANRVHPHDKANNMKTFRREISNLVGYQFYFNKN